MINHLTLELRGGTGNSTGGRAMFVLRGTVVTMRPDGQVLPGGAVYVGDDGLIAAVTPLDPVPSGFENAVHIAAGGLIYPGLIDLHNHLMYNSLPLWTEPARKKP